MSSVGLPAAGKRACPAVARAPGSGPHADGGRPSEGWTGFKRNILSDSWLRNDTENAEFSPRRLLSWVRRERANKVHGLRRYQRRGRDGT
jgi:hypothetical protein